MYICLNSKSPSPFKDWLWGAKAVQMKTPTEMRNVKSLHTGTVTLPSNKKNENWKTLKNSFISPNISNQVIFPSKVLKKKQDWFECARKHCNSDFTQTLRERNFPNQRFMEMRTFKVIMSFAFSINYSQRRVEEDSWQSICKTVYMRKNMMFATTKGIFLRPGSILCPNSRFLFGSVETMWWPLAIVMAITRRRRRNAFL